MLKTWREGGIIIPYNIYKDWGFSPCFIDSITARQLLELIDGRNLRPTAVEFVKSIEKYGIINSHDLYEIQYYSFLDIISKYCQKQGVSLLEFEFLYNSPISVTRKNSSLYSEIISHSKKI